MLSAAAFAADRGKTDSSQPAGDTVEMFKAIDAGQIDVQLIPKDSTLCRVRIKNKTDKPLSVKLPDAFAGVPVLAQRGGGGEFGGGSSSSSRSGNRSGGGQQSFGGGMGGMGGMSGMGGMGGMGGGGMGGMGGGFFSIAPDDVSDLKVTTVCLEHGKAEPRPGMKYTIKPIEQFTTKPAVREVCQMLGSGQVNQHVAQVAAWYLNNDMTWAQLAAKQRRHVYGATEPYFSPAEIQAAMQVVAKATTIAEQKKKAAKSASDENSPSQYTPSSGSVGKSS
jgi:hypothetical protein